MGDVLTWVIVGWSACIGGLLTIYGLAGCYWHWKDRRDRRRNDGSEEYVKIRAKLYGGPFDGDAAQVVEQPERIWVQTCSVCHGRKCGQTEWFHAWVRGAEVYDKSEGSEPEPGIDVRYVWANLPDPPLSKEEQERWRDLVTA